jgi:hypothetical protein
VTARLVHLDGEDHRAVERLLPWHVNGTLDAAEAAVVEAHLAACERCRADVRWQLRLREAAPEMLHPIPDAASQRATDAAWARLRDAVAASTPIADPATDAGPQPAAPAAPRAPARARLPRWFAWGMAAQLAAWSAVAVLLLAPAHEPYRALGAGSVHAANALVVFAPGTTERDIRALLRAQDAQLVAGPTGTDAWLVAVAPAKLERAIAAWRASAAVVRAESLQATRAASGPGAMP